jgi:hypothetical protein
MIKTLIPHLKRGNFNTESRPAFISMLEKSP